MPLLCTLLLCCTLVLAPSQLIEIVSVVSCLVKLKLKSDIKMMPYEDGEETKSDFLARMIMMGRVEIDEKNQ